MERKDRIDGFGAASLIGFSALLAFNQVVIKLVNAGIQPVFAAGLRSVIAVACVWAWLRLRGRSARLSRDMLGPGLLIGLVFSFEFVCLFMALDLTSVARSAVIFYSMPVWLAIAAHFLLPGERMHVVKLVGLALALAGVAVALLSRGGGAHTSLAGDLCALGAAWGWAGIALCARATRLRELRPDMQLFWQVVVSAPVLLALSPLFGPFLRGLEPWHWGALAFQGVVIVTAGFIFWLWLLSIYPAAGVASFSFLTPVFAVGFGWLILNEPVGLPTFLALFLVAAGIVLVNRPPGGRS